MACDRVTAIGMAAVATLATVQPKRASWAGQFTGVPQPTWGTGAGAVRRAAGCPVGTGTSLIAVQAPGSTGTRQGAVRALPPLLASAGTIHRGTGAAIATAAYR